MTSFSFSSARRCAVQLCTAMLPALVASSGCGGNVTAADRDPAGAGARGEASPAGTTGSGSTSGASASSTGTGGVSTGGAGPASCDDGVQNGGESGVDCGGSCPTCESPETACDDACAPAAGSCSTKEGCQMFCQENVVGWTDVVLAAYAECIATNPLCFMTVEECIMGVLYPEPLVVPIAFTGTGFVGLDGAAVVARIDNGDEPPFAEGAKLVAAGAFQFVWEVVAYATTPFLVLYYVDADGDGACSVGDVTGADYAVLTSGFEQPEAALSVTPQARGADFVCGFF